MNKSIKIFFSLLLISILSIIVIPSAYASVLLTDNFESYATGNWAEGSTNGNWFDNFNGFGTQKITNIGGTHKKVLEQAPQVSTSSAETHSSLSTSTQTFGDFDMTISANTVKQLRTGSLPNAWERDWIMWHFTDNAHAYYLICKATGWELGKLDPAYPGGQRFLATGASPTCTTNSWHTYHVIQTGNTITASINGTLLTTFQDMETPYLSGSVGLYNEDAQARFDTITVNN